MMKDKMMFWVVAGVLVVYVVLCLYAPDNADNFGKGLGEILKALGEVD